MSARGRPSAGGREEIVRSSIRLFADRGYDTVATKEIASAAGLTIGALYHHFPSKQALYEAAMLTVLTELPPLPSRGTAGPRADLERLVTWIAAVVATESSTSKMLRREFTDPRLAHPISESAAFEAPLERFSGLISSLVPGVNVRLAEATIMALLFGITGLPGLRRIAPGTVFSSDDATYIAKSICAVILNGIGACADAERG